MSAIPPTAWLAARNHAYTQLTPVEKARAVRLRTAADIESLVRLTRKSLNPRSKDALGHRLNSVVQVATLLHDSTYEISNKQEAVSATVWIMLGLVLESMASELNYLELAVKLYEDLLGTLPRLSIHTSIVIKSPNLSLAIFGTYQEHINLALRTIKVFGRAGGNIGGIVAKLSWKRDQKSFYRSLRKLKRLRDHATQEVDEIHMGEERQWRDNVMASLTSTNTSSVGIVLEMASLSLSAVHFPQFLVPPRNTSFMSREKEMETLRTCLVAEENNNRRGMRIAVVHGLGGEGKTQVAIEFAHRHRSQFECVYWIAADTPVKIASGFDEVAKKLQIEEADHAQMRSRTKEWLCDTSKTWLLIFDNVEEPADLQYYLPEAVSGSVLITSRSRRWLDQDYVHATIFLESLPIVDGVAMFQSIMQKYNRIVDPTIMSDIVREVGGFALAIRHIAYYLATTHTNGKDFLAMYKKRGAEAQRVDNYTATGVKDFSQRLATVWDLTLSKLPASSNFLLNVMAMLDPDRIPQDLFTSGSATALSTPYTTTTEQYDYAIDVLQRYSLVVMSSTENDESVLSIHRQVGRSVLNKLDHQKFQEAFHWCVRKLRNEFPHQSPFAEPLSRSWQQCESWITHLISIHSISQLYRAKLDASELLAEILVDGAIYLWERGLLDQGQKLIISAKTICGVDSSNRLLLGSISSFHGCILADKGETDQAKSCFMHEAQYKREHLLNMNTHRNRPTITDELQLANAYNNLAGILFACGEIKGARLYNHLSLSLKQRWENRHDLSYLLSLSYSNYANLHGFQHDYEEAAMWYQKALDIPASKHYLPRLALIYHNFGGMRLNQGQLQEAEHLLTEAVQLRTSGLGDHYDTANSLHVLASCYLKMTKFHEARDLLQEALRILGSHPHRDNKRLARSMFLLSVVLQHLQDPKANAIQQEARSLKREVTGVAGIGDDKEDDYDKLVPYM